MTFLWNFTKELYENDHFMEFYKGIIGKLPYYGILQRNNRKMTILWAFFYNSFIKLSLYVTWSIRMDPSHSVIKGLHCTLVFC